MEGLNVTERDIAYAEGFLEKWLDDEEAPKPVLEQLKVLADGVRTYRSRLEEQHADLADLQSKYNSLTGLQAQYLGLMAQQKEQIDQLLVETQKEFHDETRLDRG
jgi:hypothetical protein